MDIADHMGIERSLPYRALEVEEKGTFHDFNHVIRGSGASTDLKLTSEVRAAFQRELDFWLKGLSRKAAGNVTPVH